MGLLSALAVGWLIGEVRERRHRRCKTRAWLSISLIGKDARCAFGAITR